MAVNFNASAMKNCFKADVEILIDRSLHPSFHSRINSPVNMNEVNDTNVNNSVQVIYENNLDSLQIFNTSLNRFQDYNPITKLSTYKYLGNLGLAHQKLILSQFSPIGIDIGIHSFDIYGFNAKGIRYFDTKSPFTELFYVNGSKNEQLFGVLHTQNISKNFNVGVEYRRLGSEGFYTRQKSSHSNFSFFTWYKSKNGRYSLIANAIWNNLQAEENGGISNDSLFENGVGVRRNTIEIRLDSAHNNWKEKSFFVKQYLNLGYKRIKLINDSFDSISFVPTNRISHSFYYENRSFYYEDNNLTSGFYRNIYNDSLRTSDLTDFLKVENQVSWAVLLDQESKSGRTRRVAPAIYLKHQYITFSQNDTSTVISPGAYPDTVGRAGIDTSFNDLIAKGILRNSKNGKFHWEIAGDYDFYGRNKHDYSANVFLSNRFKEEYGKLSINIAIQKRSPWLIHNIYSSNHFSWKNDFDKTDLIYGKLKYVLGKRGFEVGASLSQINNYIYFDTIAMPKQSDKQLAYFQVFVIKDFSFGKWNFNNKIIYQYASDIDVIRVPELITIHSLYFEDHLFKKALFAQIGADISFNTAYYADAYMPATGQFYLQNDKKVGDYPYVDVFVNFKIKRARVFFKMEHINSGLLGNTYYMIPHYPMPDRAFKFGISWMFYD